MIHGVEQVDPPIARLELQLEHRPRYNNFALRTVLTKWRRWARINAREFLMPFAELPTFNWDGAVRLAAAPAHCSTGSRRCCSCPTCRWSSSSTSPRERGVYTPRENMRHVAVPGRCTRAWCSSTSPSTPYLGAGESAAAEPPRPGGGPLHVEMSRRRRPSDWRSRANGIACSRGSRCGGRSPVARDLVGGDSGRLRRSARAGRKRQCAGSRAAARRSSGRMLVGRRARRRATATTPKARR